MPNVPATLTAARLLTSSILELTLRREDGRPFPPFAPGQYATLSFPDYAAIHGQRSFSIASAATDLSQLSFGIRLGGPYSRALGKLRPGDRVKVNGPFGHFTYDVERGEAATFVAGGIGITPFLSMIRTAVERGLRNDLSLIYCIRSIRDAAYVEELKVLNGRDPRFQVVFVVGDGNIPSDGRFVAGGVRPELLVPTTTSPSEPRTYYVCGPPPFMIVVKKLLSQAGIPSSAVRTERFGVGSTALIEGGSTLPLWVFAAWLGLAGAFLLLIVQQELDRRALIESLGGLVTAPAPLPWPLLMARAMGIASFLVLTVQVLIGMLMTTGLFYRIMSPATAWSLHRAVAATLLCSILVHLTSLKLYVPYGLRLVDFLVPFTAAYETTLVALGVIGFLLLNAVIASSLYTLTSHPRFWRSLHILGFPMYLLLFFHGTRIGSDAHLPWVRAIFSGSAVAIGFAFVYRLYWKYRPHRRLVGPDGSASVQPPGR